VSGTDVTGAVVIDEAKGGSSTKKGLMYIAQALYMGSTISIDTNKLD